MSEFNLFARRLPRLLAALIAITGLAVAVAVAAATGTPAPAVAQSDGVVSGDGVAGGLLGSSAAELRDQLGPDWNVGELTRVTIDFEGHVVSRDGRAVFRAVRPDPDVDALTLFIVNDDAVATAEGIGVGSTIEDGAVAYGAPTLRTEGGVNGREFIEFEDGPDGIRFRTSGVGSNTIGEYPEGATTTDVFDPQATIVSLWVGCGDLGDACETAAAAQPTATPTPEDATPEPTPTETPTPTPTPEEDTPDPTPTPTPRPEGSESGSGDGDTLPRTGADSDVLAAFAALMLLLGGASLMVARRDLGPRWLGR